MQTILRLLKNPLFVLFLSLLLVVIGLIVFFNQEAARETAQTPTITSEPQVIEPNTPNTSDEPLTETEEQFLQATPQVFPETDTNKTGTLVIISDPRDTNVVLEAFTESETEGTQIPYNTAPFKFSSMPVGRYSVSAAKDGYEWTTFQFSIEENKVTRIKIQLDPITEE